MFFGKTLVFHIFLLYVSKSYHNIIIIKTMEMNQLTAHNRPKLGFSE